MLITVCIKPVPNPQLTPMLDSNTHQIVGLERHKYVVNPADLAALELALRVKEQAGAEVAILTVGRFVTSDTSSCANVRVSTTGLRQSTGRLWRLDSIRRCLAMGADRAIAITLNKPFREQEKKEANPVAASTVKNFRPLNMDSMITARILAHSIRYLNADMVLCGGSSYDQGTGIVGPAIAEYLGFALVMDALTATWESEEGSLLLKRRLEKGNRELVRCPLPAVITANPGKIVPRYFKMPALVKAFRNDIETIDLSALGVSLKEAAGLRSVRLLKMSPPRARTKKVWTPSSSLSPEARSRLIMSGGNLGSKQGQVVEGDPSDAAGEIIRFLQGIGALPPG